MVVDPTVLKNEVEPDTTPVTIATVEMGTDPPAPPAPPDPLAPPAPADPVAVLVTVMVPVGEVTVTKVAAAPPAEPTAEAQYAAP